MTNIASIAANSVAQVNVYKLIQFLHEQHDWKLHLSSQIQLYPNCSNIAYMCCRWTSKWATAMLPSISMPHRLQALPTIITKYTGRSISVSSDSALEFRKKAFFKKRRYICAYLHTHVVIMSTSMHLKICDGMYFNQVQRGLTGAHLRLNYVSNVNIRLSSGFLLQLRLGTSPFHQQLTLEDTKRSK